MDKLFKDADLRPYFRVAEDKAKESPCSRRQYGAMIAYDNLADSNPLWVVEMNSRQARCCDGACVRDQYKFPNGQRIEVGAETHAEMAALITARNKGAVFILVGFQKGEPLYGSSVYACHSCALAIKFAGYKYVYIKTDKDTIRAVSVAEMIEFREEEWIRED